MRSSDFEKIRAWAASLPEKIKPAVQALRPALDMIRSRFEGKSPREILSDNGTKALIAAVLTAVICLGALSSACVQCVCSGGCTGCADCGGSSREMVFIGGSESLESMEFIEDAYYISVGSRLALRLRTRPEIFDDIITWSSSDPAVLQVDGDGVVTAVTQGTAVITARSGALSDSVTISVVDDILVEAADCVRLLSEGCDDYSFSAAQLMLDRLERGKSEGTDIVRNLISEIIAYAGTGDRDELDAAIDASGMDGTLCRRAAAFCWAYGERQCCDGVLTFAGDCTLAYFNEGSGKDRFPSVYEAADSLTYPFDLVKGAFVSDDITVINFEGTLTDSTKHLDKTFYFRGPPAYAKILPGASIEAANLANNHSLDYLQTGYEDTVKHLTDAGVAVTAEGQPLTLNVGEKAIPVVMLSANLVGVDRDEPVETLMEEIKQYKNDRTIVAVNLHWGAEGLSWPEKWQRDAAHRLIDAGADLIVGHHPHVIQGIEIYNGKYIAYSLGNFAFGGNAYANAPLTFILRARLTADENGTARVEGISMLPCRTTSTGTKVNNYQPMLCFGRDGDGIYSELIRLGRDIGGADSIDRPDI